jgi:ribonuclease HII
MHNAIDKIIKNMIVKNNDENNLINNYNKNFYLLIDGNNFKPYIYMNKNNNMLEEINHILIEGGDNKYCSIAAASILSKVERDKYIKEMTVKYTKLNLFYDLEKNKGYGTKKHMDGIKKIGISPWHRVSFGICKESQINDEEFYI